jgi:hypothetical protein
MRGIRNRYTADCTVHGGAFAPGTGTVRKGPHGWIGTCDACAQQRKAAETLYVPGMLRLPTGDVWDVRLPGHKAADRPGHTTWGCAPDCYACEREQRKVAMSNLADPRWLARREWLSRMRRTLARGYA